MNNEDKKLWSGFCQTHKSELSNCPDEIMLSSYIDGKLSTDETDSVEHHLAECECCLDIVSQIKLPDTSAQNKDYSDLNEKVFDNVFKPAIPFNAFRHLKIAALAASFIIIFSVVMVISKNGDKTVTTDAKIARIIELYNNNKYYRLSENSIDGFEPSESFCSTTGIMHHKADIDKNGRISMNEVLQYISKNNPQPSNQVVGN